MSNVSIVPRLVVDDGPAAVDFYLNCLNATEQERAHLPDGRMVQAELQVGDQLLFVTQADGETSHSPTQIGGSPVLLTLRVPDADAVGQAMVDRGAEVVFPIDDQFYGRREGRLRDPSGHLWIISQLLDG
ncbi:MAG: VOC family protein [Actinomycetota bacterium]